MSLWMRASLPRTSASKILPLKNDEFGATRQELLEKYIGQHGLGTDLVCSTDERPWATPPQVNRSQLFVVLNIPKRLASAGAISATFRLLFD